MGRCETLLDTCYQRCDERFHDIELWEARASCFDRCEERYELCLRREVKA